MHKVKLESLMYYRPVRGYFEFKDNFYTLRVQDLGSRPVDPYLFCGPLGELETTELRLFPFIYHGNHWVSRGHAKLNFEPHWWIVVATMTCPTGELRAQIPIFENDEK